MCLHHRRGAPCGGDGRGHAAVGGTPLLRRGAGVLCKRSAAEPKRPVFFLLLLPRRRSSWAREAAGIPGPRPGRSGRNPVLAWYRQWGQPDDTAASLWLPGAHSAGSGARLSARRHGNSPRLPDLHPGQHFLLGHRLFRTLGLGRWTRRSRSWRTACALRRSGGRSHGGQGPARCSGWVTPCAIAPRAHQLSDAAPRRGSSKVRSRGAIDPGTGG